MTFREGGAVWIVLQQAHRKAVTIKLANSDKFVGVSTLGDTVIVDTLPGGMIPSDLPEFQWGVRCTGNTFGLDAVRNGLTIYAQGRGEEVVLKSGSPSWRATNFAGNGWKMESILAGAGWMHVDSDTLRTGCGVDTIFVVKNVASVEDEE